MDWFKRINWHIWIATIILIVAFREGALWVTTQFSHPELGNLAGLISLLIVLSLWRMFGHIPSSLVETNNKIMKESAFAFLPISAGSLIMLVHMGEKIPTFLCVLFISTLVPLWLYAKIAKRWL